MYCVYSFLLLKYYCDTKGRNKSIVFFSLYICFFVHFFVHLFVFFTLKHNQYPSVNENKNDKYAKNSHYIMEYRDLM